MVYEAVNAVNGLVVSRRQGEPKAELMLVLTNGRSQVLELNMLMLAKLVEQGAGVLARAANELPAPPRRVEPQQTLTSLSGVDPNKVFNPNLPAARGEHEVMKDVCKLLKEENKEENNGGKIDSAAVQRNQEYVDVANRTDTAPDSISWRRRTAPRLAST